MKNTSSSPKSVRDPHSKTRLLCEHATELSTQCRLALRWGVSEALLDLQARKQVIMDELAANLARLDSAGRAALESPVEHLRAALKAEIEAADIGREVVCRELSNLQASQGRLTKARLYANSAVSPLLNGGGTLHIAG
jgi:hypothetical protein